jgi:hypothetical protein
VWKRWLAVGHGVRDWALAHPAEYGLLYGSPVPGYSAPQDTVAPAASVIFMLAEIAAAAVPAEMPHSAPLPGPVRADLRRLIDQQGGGISEELLERVFAGWTHLFGLASFEVFGRLQGTIEARREYFDHQMGLMADLAGLPPTHGATRGPAMTDRMSRHQPAHQPDGLDHRRGAAVRKGRAGQRCGTA